MPLVASASPNDPSQPLDNPRHERFARLVASGRSDLEAYQIALGASAETAKTNAWRLRDTEGILDRIKHLQREIASKMVLTKAEKRQFLRKIVLTPPSEVNEKSDICQGVKIRKTDKGEEIIEVKIADKLKALELDARLAGELERPGNVQVNIWAVDDREEVEVIEVETERTQITE